MIIHIDNKPVCVRRTGVMIGSFEVCLVWRTEHKLPGWWLDNPTGRVVSSKHVYEVKA